MPHRPSTTVRVVGTQIMLSGLPMSSQESEEGPYGGSLRRSTLSQTVAQATYLRYSYIDDETP